MSLTYVENVTRVYSKANSVVKSQIKVSFDRILSLGETRGEIQTNTLTESCMNNAEREWGTAAVL